MSLSSDFLEMQKGQKANAAEKIALRVLTLLEAVYIKGVERRYKKDTRRAEKLDIPVVSVGNITVGGTGKTPCIIYLAAFLKEKGWHPAILSRGYKSRLEKKGGIVSDMEKILLSQKDAGDEPFMMALRLPGVPVLIGKNRNVSAHRAEKMGADVLLLDDGFQYWKLVKDKDIVLIDCTNPFGGGHVMPRGLMREPVSGLKRASLIILTKSEQVNKKMKDDVIDVIRQVNDKVPVIESRHAPRALVPFSSWKKGIHKGLLSPWRGKKAYLVSGIGNPAAFAETAAEAGLLPVDAAAFRDHHAYTEDDIKNVESRALRSKAKLMITTEKDAVKMIGLKHMDALKLPLYVLEIQMVFDGDGRDVLEDALSFGQK